MKNKYIIEQPDVFTLCDMYYSFRMDDMIERLNFAESRRILKDKYGENNLKMYYNKLWC